MKRASYREAIQWMADNDDTEWVEEEEDTLISVTGALIADIFDVPQERVKDDLRRALDKRARKTGGSSFRY